MRFDTDPMPALRADAERRINEYFNIAATRDAQQDHEHALKRAAAQQIVSGRVAPVEFLAAAAVEGVSVETLAAMILARPDDVMARGNERRKMVLAARAATVPSEISALLQGIQGSAAAATAAA